MDRNDFFNAEYFAAYGNDPKRLQMYRAERNRIEKYKLFGRILDVGCGVGAFLDEFPSREWDKYGVDVNHHAIAAARTRGIQVHDVADSYNYPSNYFDVVVFRGSLQHLLCPFQIIQTCIKLLKPNGLMAFLATPNSNSPYFRRFGTLPFLTPNVNILQPSDLMMRHALENLGMCVHDIRFPYLDTPYAKPVKDHLFYLLSFIGIKKKFAFWRSFMEIYAIKPDHSEASK